MASGCARLTAQAHRPRAHARHVRRAGLIFAGIQLAANVYFYVIRGHEPPFPIVDEPDTPMSPPVERSSSIAPESSGPPADVPMKSIALPFGTSEEPTAAEKEHATRLRSKSVTASRKLQVGAGCAQLCSKRTWARWLGTHRPR